MSKDKGVLLYSASKQAGVNYPREDQSQIEIPVGDSFDYFYQQGKQKEAEERTHLDYLIELYKKVGSFYNWSYNEFMETPFEVIKKLNDDIDKKIDQINNGNVGFVSYPQLFVALGIALAFGGKD